MQPSCTLLDFPRVATVPDSPQLHIPEPGSVPLFPSKSLHRKSCYHGQALPLLQNQPPVALSSSSSTNQLHHSLARSAPGLAQLHPSVLPLASVEPLEQATLASSPQSQQLEFLESTFACTSPAGPPDEDRKRNSDFQINFGRAIRSLREDIPTFFKHEGDMSIYADNMHFRDNISAALWSRTFDLHGINQYQRHCQRMRLVFKFLFKHSDVQVWRFWPKDRYITVARWTVKNYPRLISSQCLQIDGISEFRFNEDGYIQEHILDVIDWNGLRAALEKRREKAALAGLVPNACNGWLPPDGAF